MVCEVVLIDDDPDFSGSLCEVLEHEGHNVHAFSTPEAAFEWLLSGGRADLVLLDLRTPGMSARRFRALLMSTPMLRDLDVVVVSGAPEANEIGNAVGASEVFGKPIDLERLLATVRRHCRVNAQASPDPRT
jgi:twitching motility two-component system response regulator PilH